MASAVDSRLAYARLSAVATASRLPTANRGSNNSYTTSWDTTVLLARKPQIKRSSTLDFAGSEPDFMVFKRRQGIQTCHIVELKDGHVFDTKKASAERQAMHGFIERNAQHIQYRFMAHFCAFNQNDRQAIWEGFKKRIAREEAMTGREFCELLETDYDAIVEVRKMHGPDNVEFFLSELVKIESIRPRLLQLLNG